MQGYIFSYVSKPRQVIFVLLNLYAIYGGEKKPL